MEYEPPCEYDDYDVRTSCQLCPYRGTRQCSLEDDEQALAEFETELLVEG